MVRSEPTNNRTEGINTNHSTMFTLLLELNLICEQRWIGLQFELQNSPSRVFAFDGKIYTTVSFSKPVKTITTKIFDVFRIIILKQQKFSQSDPALIRPKLASVLIHAYLCYRIRIGLDHTIKILDWIRIAKISDPFNTSFYVQNNHPHTDSQPKKSSINKSVTWLVIPHQNKSSWFFRRNQGESTLEGFEQGHPDIGLPHQYQSLPRTMRPVGCYKNDAISKCCPQIRAGVRNLFTITGHINCGLSLVSHK